MTKGPGDGVYSSSTCKLGEIEAVAIATGVQTFFGKVACLVDSTNQVGHFIRQACNPTLQDLLTFFIGKFMIEQTSVVSLSKFSLP